MAEDVRTVLPSVHVNLPADADRAPFESVTLPNTFDLDAMEMDDHMEGPDNHLKPYDQITMQGEQYVSIFFNEENRSDSSPPVDISKSKPDSEPIEEGTLPSSEREVGNQTATNENGVRGGDSSQIYRMEDDVLPPFEDEPVDATAPADDNMGDGGPAPNIQIDANVQNLDESHFYNESPEVMRHALHTNEAEGGNAIIGIAGVTDQSVPSTSKIRSLSPIMEHLSVSGEGSFPSPAIDKVPAVASTDDLDILNTGISLGQHLDDVVLQPSPPVNRNVRKRRKKREYFDEVIVISNVKMEKQLKDPSKLVCKRRKLPCSALDVWRCNRCQNERFLHEPLLSGMSPKLQEVMERKVPSSRSESTSYEASNGHTDAQGIGPVLPDMAMEPEHPRFGVHVDEIMHDLTQSSPAKEVSTLSAGNLGSVSDKGKALELGKSPTFEYPGFAEPVGPDFATPSVNLEEHLHLDDSNLGEFPTLQKSADAEELTFLEASNASSGGYDVSGVGTMSATTRKVAQYLKELSPMAHTPDEQSEYINLNKILERKPRKQCARMFFETLVLKSYGYINVKQDEPYGDILITRTPALFSMKF